MEPAERRPSGLLAGRIQGLSALALRLLVGRAGAFRLVRLRLLGFPHMGCFRSSAPCHAAVPRTTSARHTHCEVLSLAPAAGVSPAKRGEAQRSGGEAQRSGGRSAAERGAKRSGAGGEAQRSGGRSAAERGAKRSGAGSEATVTRRRPATLSRASAPLRALGFASAVFATLIHFGIAHSPYAFGSEA